jgi:cytochrome c
MRAISATILSVAAAALLAGCGKKEEAPVMPSSPPLTTAAPESAAPAGPTPEQQKLLAALPAPYNTGDPTAGEAKFIQCRACHSIVKGGPNLTGPNLWGIYGTKAAEVPGFSFSDAMKASKLTWDAPTLDKWIENPKSVLAETKMTYIGMKDAKDRQDVIAYLAIQRDQ